MASLRALKIEIEADYLVRTEGDESGIREAVKELVEDFGYDRVQVVVNFDNLLALGDRVLVRADNRLGRVVGVYPSGGVDVRLDSGELEGTFYRNEVAKIEA